MKRKSPGLLTIIALICFTAVNSFADVRIKTRTVAGKDVSEKVIYLKGRRQREETKGLNLRGEPFDFAWIRQCDLHKAVGINNLKRSYFVGDSDNLESLAFPFGSTWFAESLNKPLQPGKGVLTEILTITDTGERREMFGYTARRIKTSQMWEATPQLCNRNSPRTESDGWYIDLLYGLDCSPDISGFSVISGGFPGSYNKCVASYEKHHYQFRRKLIGTPRLGFPLTLTITTYSDDGRPFIATREVTELTTTEFDPALFEMPADYALMPIKRK
jgi:hypothetical protein